MGSLKKVPSRATKVVQYGKKQTEGVELLSSNAAQRPQRRRRQTLLRGIGSKRTEANKLEQGQNWLGMRKNVSQRGWLSPETVVSTEAAGNLSLEILRILWEEVLCHLIELSS